MTSRRLTVLDPSRDPSANLYEHFPSGWFDVARSHELRAGSVVTKRLAGRDVVLYRTESGVACAVAPYCPHMGAHLGHGGCVRGEHIVCPFHAFEFGTDGRCKATGYGTPPPPRAKLTMHAVREIHGCVFVWHGAAGEAPSFDLPHVDDASEGFHPMLDRVFVMRGHPQETSENSVDLGHFGPVHGYRNVRVIEPVATDGAVLRIAYEMDRDVLPGVPMLGEVHAEFRIHVHGLGYSRVEVRVPKLGFETRHHVHSTPIEREKVHLRVGFALRKNTFDLPRGSKPVRAIFERAFMQVGIRAFAHDVGQDFAVWNHKRYLHPPQLAQGDGPVGAYRRWAKQFYPQPLEVEPRAREVERPAMERELEEV